MQPLLEQLTRLQSLSLEHSGSPCARRSSTTAAPVPLAALQSMPELTELRLEGLRLDTGLQQISTLSKLVVLSIKQVPSIAYESFTGLQLLQGLSHLELSTPFMLDSQMLPGFSKLQRLKSLSVRPSIAADVLQQAGQLQRLQVLQGDNYSDFLAGQEVQVWQGHSSDLLSALPQLHHLTYLDLSAILSYSIYGAISLAGPADAFSALTTSSNLADLRLPKLVAPSGTWQHAFQPSRQLPQLRQLNLGQVQPLLSTDDIRNLSLACPALEALNLHESVAPNPVPTHVFEINFGDGLDNAGEVLIERIEENYNEDLVSAGVAALAQCTALTKLFLTVTDDMVGQVLQLTNIKDLLIEDHTSFASMRKLTALTQLTQLRHADVRYSDPRTDKPSSFFKLPHPTTHCRFTWRTGFDCTAPSGTSPDVWEQLQAELGRAEELPPDMPDGFTLMRSRLQDMCEILELEAPSIYVS